MPVQVSKLSAKQLKEFKSLIHVFENVFEMRDLQMPPDTYLQKLLEKDDFFAFVALDAATIVGGLTCYTMQQYYSERPLVYIYDLAVLQTHQRQGIGKQLIAATNAYCKSIGTEAVMVEADVADVHALEFYRSTGAEGQPVVHFDYPLDRLL